MFVLKRIPDGRFVARPGSKKSYTNALQNARVFPTREAADGNRCVDNERVVAVDDLLRVNR